MVIKIALDPFTAPHNCEKNYVRLLQLRSLLKSLQTLDSCWDSIDRTKDSMKSMRGVLETHMQLKPGRLNGQKWRGIVHELVAEKMERFAQEVDEEETLKIDASQIHDSQRPMCSFDLQPPMSVRVPKAHVVAPKIVVHTISTNLPVMHAGTPSDRKSFMKDLAKDFVVKSPNAPANFKQHYIVEATLKAVRLCILNYDSVPLSRTRFATLWPPLGVTVQPRTICLEPNYALTCNVSQTMSRLHRAPYTLTSMASSSKFGASSSQWNSCCALMPMGGKSE